MRCDEMANAKHTLKHKLYNILFSGARMFFQMLSQITFDIFSTF